MTPDKLADGRATQAIKVTRSTLERILLKSDVLIQMTAHNVKPEALEDKIAEMLEYLEKTTPKKPKEEAEDT